MQPEIVETRTAPIIQPAAAQNPMHRTDIEGFGHHEDRIEMEMRVGALGRPAYATTAPATSSYAYSPMPAHFSTMP